MRCMHCSDLLKDLHPVCLLCDVYVYMCMHAEGVQCGGGESICYRTGLVFSYSRYLEWCVTHS